MATLISTGRIKLLILNLYLFLPCLIWYLAGLSVQVQHESGGPVCRVYAAPTVLKAVSPTQQVPSKE